jgi:enterochelin esterase family protein
MKGKYALIFWLIPLFVAAQGPGKVKTTTFYSKALADSMNYNVYLPAGYDNADGNYPVFLLLHGYTGNHKDWVKQGELDKTMNELIENERSIPMIVVMPDAGNSWYVDSDPAISWGRYESAVIEDLTAHVRDKYRTADQKMFIAGLSMGGYGALHLAFKYPQHFRAAAALSGAFMPELPDSFNILEKTFGDPANTKRYQKENPFVIATADSSKHLPVYISCGDDDMQLYHRSVQMYDTLTSKGYSAELRITDGGHTWEVWRREIVEVIEFFNDAAQREQ